MMELVPIRELLEENEEFISNPLCQETIYRCVDFYKKVGFSPPWICYYVLENCELVGSAAFKGKPSNGSVEIAYGTQQNLRHQGIGTAICKLLVDLASKTDSSVRITARTLPENNFSARVLNKNNFKYLGVVQDPEDGPVWEWEYQGDK
jgi:RimJ/RimL family protein N-acetyltransferase